MPPAALNALPLEFASLITFFSGPSLTLKRLFEECF